MTESEFEVKRFGTPSGNASASPYSMTLSLNVLNHLGINLYSNVPAVLSEVVANSWDADAEHVVIDIDQSDPRVVITDDGHGMTQAEVNERFLHVGFNRRKEGGAGITPGFNRTVMGRKGIGKLSLFSIAGVIEVHTVKDGERSAFKMVVDDIRKLIEGGGEQTYRPDPVDAPVVEIDKGTRIILTDLKRALYQTEKALRRRLARRFSIIGEEFNFNVSVNGSPISIEDRDYFHKLQYLWCYGDDGESWRRKTFSGAANVRARRTEAHRELLDRPAPWVWNEEGPRDFRDQRLVRHTGL